MDFLEQKTLLDMKKKNERGSVCYNTVSGNTLSSWDCTEKQIMLLTQESV